MLLLTFPLLHRCRSRHFTEAYIDMATFLNSPNTPAVAHTFYHDDNVSRSHKANLSGATMLDLLSGPEGSIAAAYESSSLHQRTPKSRRPSQASITKSQLRQTNRTLVEIIHSVQAELATQREAMLDMQAHVANQDPRLCAAPHNCWTPQAVSDQKQRRCYPRNTKKLGCIPEGC